MINIAICYSIFDNKYNLAKKYYLMAIEKGNTTALYRLANYYGSIELNYNLMLKYYILAIEKGHFISFIQLGSHYQNWGNYILMKKYYLLYYKYKNNIATLNCIYNNLQYKLYKYKLL